MHENVTCQTHPVAETPASRLRMIGAAAHSFVQLLDVEVREDEVAADCLDEYLLDRFGLARICGRPVGTLPFANHLPPIADAP
eukprot:6207154-Prymnesium_polylepis.1